MIALRRLKRKMLEPEKIEVAQTVYAIVEDKFPLECCIVRSLWTNKRDAEKNAKPDERVVRWGVLRQKRGKTK